MANVFSDCNLYMTKWIVYRANCKGSMDICLEHFVDRVFIKSLYKFCNLGSTCDRSKLYCLSLTKFEFHLMVRMRDSWLLFGTPLIVDTYPYT
jgi:hypothetical protein